MDPTTTTSGGTATGTASTDEATYRKKQQNAINWAKNNLQEDLGKDQSVNWFWLVAFVVVIAVCMWFYIRKYSIRRVSITGKNLGYLQQKHLLPSFDGAAAPVQPVIASKQTPAPPSILRTPKSNMTPGFVPSKRPTMSVAPDGTVYT